MEVVYTTSVRIPTENSGIATLGIFKEGFFTKGRFLEVGVKGNTESSGISWVSQTPKGDSCCKNEETELHAESSLGRSLLWLRVLTQKELRE